MTVLDGVRPMRPLREVLRIVECIEGEPDVIVRASLRPGYARTKPRLSERGALGWTWSWANDAAFLRSEIPLVRKSDGLAGTATMKSGERRAISLSYTRADPMVIVELGEAANERLSSTARWWRDWSSRCRYDGPFRAAVIRSAIVLQQLSYAPSGAIVAAPTTSLPESPGGHRNWDYRYCWLRDAGMTTRALVALGYQEEACGFLNWLLHATRLTWPKLCVLFDVFGGRDLDEDTLPHLKGYAASRPVRVGNAAHAQFQLGGYGEVILSAEAAVSAGLHLDTVEQRMLRGLGETILEIWQEPDCGIWEIRSAPRHFTLSKAMCWATLSGLLRLDDHGSVSLGRKRDAFLRTRAAIQNAIETRGFSATLDSYTSEFDGDDVDASLLLLPHLGFVSACSPRMHSTYERVWERLSVGDLLRRYRSGFDGDNSPEGAFGIAGFWAVGNLAKRGELERAEALFAHLLSFANDLGLFAEEIDPATGTALGNFPQGFTHVGVINAANAIEAARQSRAQRP